MDVFPNDICSQRILNIIISLSTLPSRSAFSHPKESVNLANWSKWIWTHYCIHVYLCHMYRWPFLQNIAYPGALILFLLRYLAQPFKHRKLSPSQLISRSSRNPFHTGNRGESFAPYSWNLYVHIF